MLTNRGFAFVPILLAVLVIMGLGFGYSHFHALINPSGQQKSTGETAARDIAPSISWQTYTSQTMGVSFSYPPIYTVQDSGTIIGLQSDIRETNSTSKITYALGIDFGKGSGTGKFNNETFMEWVNRIEGPAAQKIAIDGIPAYRIDDAEGGMGTRSGFILLMTPDGQPFQMNYTPSSSKLWPQFDQTFEQILSSIKFTR